MPTGDGDQDRCVEPPEEMPPYYGQDSPLTQLLGPFEQAPVPDPLVIAKEMDERYERVYPCLACEQANKKCRGKKYPKCTRCKEKDLECRYPEREIQREQCWECHRLHRHPKHCNNRPFADCDRCKRRKLPCNPVVAVKAGGEDPRCEECKRTDKSPCDRGTTGTCDNCYKTGQLIHCDYVPWTRPRDDKLRNSPSQSEILKDL